MAEATSPTPALVVCAHGTRDPDGRVAVADAMTAVAGRLPGVSVLPAFVDVQEPSVVDVVTGLPRLPATARTGVVVPFLLAAGYHVHVDIAEAVALRSDVVVAPALGPDDALVDLVLDRMRQAAVPADAAVILAPAGSSDPRAQADSARTARRVAAGWGSPVDLAYAAGPRPSVADAVDAARRRGARSVAVASYLLAPGLFQRRIEASGADLVTGPLLPDERLVELVVTRYRTAVAG